MKFFANYLILFLSLDPLSACGIFNNGQSQVNEVTQGLALVGKTFINVFEDHLDDCLSLNEVFVALDNSIQNCDNSGTFQLISQNLNCQSNNPLDAQVHLQLIQDNCQDQETGLLSDGTLEIVLDFSTQGNIAVLSANSFLSEGRLFDFDHFAIRVDFATNSLSCVNAEDIEVIEDFNSNTLRTCSVRSDCEKCLF